MGWVEDVHGAVLLVKQKRGRKLWTLPGGKVLATEAIDVGLKREIKEETGARVTAATQIAIFDRPDKRNVTFLYRVALQSGRAFVPQAREIERVEYHDALPRDCSPSLRHFWKMLRRPALTEISGEWRTSLAALGVAAEKGH